MINSLQSNSFNKYNNLYKYRDNPNVSFGQKIPPKYNSVTLVHKGHNVLLLLACVGMFVIDLFKNKEYPLYFPPLLYAAGKMFYDSLEFLRVSKPNKLGINDLPFNTIVRAENFIQRKTNKKM